MTEPRSLLDPFGLWRSLGAQLEKGLDQLADRGVRSDRFARGMQTALSASLISKKLTTELQQRLLEALNLPSRSDIQALADKVQAIEDRIIGISATLDRLGRDRNPGQGMLPLPAPPRTRRPLPQEPAVIAPAPGVRRKARKTRP